MKRKQINIQSCFYEIVRELPDNERVVMYDAIFGLAFEGKEPRLNSLTLRTAWMVIRPMLQNLINKSNAGMAGGAPKGNQNARKMAKSENVDFEEINPQKNKQKTNRKQTEIKQKSIKKQTENKQETNTKQTPDGENSNIIINNNNTIKGETPAAPAAEPVKNNDDPHNNKGRIFDSTKNNNNINNLNNNIIPEIIKLYNNICAKEKKLPSLLAISDKRRAKLRLRWQEWATMQDVGATPLDVFTAICEKVVATPFCTGENNRGWRASFDFIIENDSNYVKILEGRYDTQKQQTTDYGSRHLNERAAENEYWRNQHELARAIVAGGGNPATFPDDGAF